MERPGDRTAGAAHGVEELVRRLDGLFQNPVRFGLIASGAARAFVRDRRASRPAPDASGSGVRGQGVRTQNSTDSGGTVRARVGPPRVASV